MKSEHKVVIYSLLFSSFFLAVSCNSTDYRNHKSVHYISKSIAEFKSWFKDDVKIPKDCTERLYALGQHNNINYAYYYVSVERLNRSLDFLKANADYMSEDGRKLYINKLSTKIDLLCARIESEYHQS